MKTFVIGLISIVAILFLLILLFNKPILSSDSPSVLKLITKAIAPPDNLYSYLLKEEIDFVTAENVVKFEFQNNYAGKHDVGILLDNFSDELYFKSKSERYRLKSELEISFYVDDRLILSRTIYEEYAPFIGHSGKGLTFFTYSTSQDLPLDRAITCKIKIIKADKFLSDNYGPVRFFIKKISDK